MEAHQIAASIVKDASLLNDERLSPAFAAAYREHFAARTALDDGPADDDGEQAREQAYLAALRNLDASPVQTWTDFGVRVGALFEAGGDPGDDHINTLLADARRLLDQGKPAPAANVDDMQFGPLVTQDELHAGLRSHDEWRPSLGIVMSFGTFDRANLSRVMGELEAGKVPDFTPATLLDTIHDLHAHYTDTADMLDSIQARALVACMDISGLKSADVFGEGR